MSARYVLGLGGSVDYEIEWSSTVLEELATRHGVRLADLDPHTTVMTERDLIRSLLGLMRDGVGGERFVSSSEVVADFARSFRVRTTLGGTCVRAAIAMAALGLASTVHLVSIDDTVRRLLPRSTRYVCSAERDTLDPHLVVQFPAGARVRLVDGEVVASRADRVIYVNDPPNRRLLIAEAFGDVVARADVVLVSGFNVVQDREVLEHRVADVRRHLARRRPGTLVYFEDAGYHVPAMARRVRDLLVCDVDVYAMNEHEFQGWLGHDVDLLDPRAVAQGLTDLADVVPARTRVVHTEHWALAHGHGAGRYREALRGGAAMAATRFVVGDALTAAAYEDTLRVPPRARGAAFARDLEAVLPGTQCVPAFAVHAREPTTIGLGDTFVGGFLAAWGRS